MTLKEKLPYLLLAIKHTFGFFINSILLVFSSTLLSVLVDCTSDFNYDLIIKSENVFYDMYIHFFNLKALSILLIILIIYYFNFLKLINKNLNKIINNDQVINDYILKISSKHNKTILSLSLIMVAIYGVLDSKSESSYGVMFAAFIVYPAFSLILSFILYLILASFYVIVSSIFNVIFEKELKEQ